MARPKRDERTKDTIEVVNKAGNRARVDPGSATETYFKARGYKPVEDADESDDGKAALLRPRQPGVGAPAPHEPEKPRTFAERTPEPDPKDSKGKGGKD